MRLVALLLVAFIALEADVEPQPLAIKPGLWELRRIRNYDGRQDVRRKCLIKDPTDPFGIIRRREQIVRRSTGSLLEIETRYRHIEGGSEGTLRIEVLDSGNVKGARRLMSSYMDASHDRSYTFTGNWIGPSCEGTSKSR